MSYLGMKSELELAIPGMSRIYAGTLINRAWRVVRDATLWSFQLNIGSFFTPPMITAGTVTFPSLLPSPPLLVGDAAASAAWAAVTFPPLTSYQFRIGNYSIYNIIKYDTITYAPFGALTLDRPFVDILTAAGTGFGQGGFGQGGFGGGGSVETGYQIFQNYYVAPSPTFKRWLSVQDVVNGYSLNIWTGRRDVNFADPMRQMTTNPIAIMGIGDDKRVGSATLGQEMYELWPIPSSRISYMTWYVDRGADLVNNNDTLPDPITEDLILTKARAYAYEWAEARKDVMAAKGSGANYAVLKKTAEDDFLARMHTLRLEDKDAVDAFLARMKNANAALGINPWYNSGIGRASMGWPVSLYRSM